MTNWKRDQPIVIHLRRWVPAIFPIIHKNHPPGRGGGGYVARTTAMGTFSFHSEGRAADIYLSAFDVTEKKIGDGLFDMFRKWNVELGIDHVIWNRQIWSLDKPTVLAYTGKRPHTDHVHAAFTKNGSQLQPPLLIPLLDGIYLDVYGTFEGQE